MWGINDTSLKLSPENTVFYKRHEGIFREGFLFGIDFHLPKKNVISLEISEFNIGM